MLVDAAAADGAGLATSVTNLIAAWPQLEGASTDEIHVVASSRFVKRTQETLGFCHRHTFEPGVLGRLRAQYVQVRSIANRVRPDVLLATIPIVPVGSLPCPVAVICHDLRHELRPSEFGRIQRMVRAVEYRRAYRRAWKIVAISARTKNDLVDRYPSLSQKIVVVPWGSDHLPPYERSPKARSGPAIAFAHHANKRPEMAIRAWALMKSAPSGLPVLLVVGASNARASELQRLAESLGLPRDLLTIRGELDDAAYAQTLAASRMLVLPSSFEGFGLPVLEALRYEIPVVVTPDSALVEVGGNHVTVAADYSPEALAEGVRLALLHDTAVRRDAGAAWAERFTWRSAASSIRKLMADGV